MTKKELSTLSEPIACAVCERTMLKGERPEPFLVRDGGRRMVCELCVRRAETAGWIREGAHADLPAAGPREDRGGGWLGRMRRRTAAMADPGAAADGASGEPEPAEVELGSSLEEASRFDAAAEASLTASQGAHTGPRDPRAIRAVPTNADVKAAHALEIFNATEHARTVAGLGRTLGAPWVSALPVAEAPSQVSIVVAWELSWYRFSVDLSDARQPVELVARGEEIDDLDEASRVWNASALTDGTLAPGA